MAQVPGHGGHTLPGRHNSVLDLTDDFPWGPLDHPPRGANPPDDSFNYDLSYYDLMYSGLHSGSLQHMREQARRPESVAAAPDPLTGISQQGRHGHPHQQQMPEVQSSPTAANGSDSYSQSVDVCLSKALELFPDINHKFVEELCVSHSACESHRRGDLSYIERVIEDILGKSSYPKEKKGLKRKRPEEEDDDQDPTDDAFHSDSHYVSTAIKILAQEFPHVPSNYIRQMLADKQKLYPVYLSLATQESSSGKATMPYERLKRPRKSLAKSPQLAYCDRDWTVEKVSRELKAARAKTEKDAGKYHITVRGRVLMDKAIARKKKEHDEAERLNEEEHTRAGTLVECQCCYLDNPSNRSVPCEGEDVHFFCYSCLRGFTETQIGLMKYELRCFDTSGCQAGFGRSHLKEALGETIMEKLDSLRQEDEISRACLDGLEGCPFCEFKAICPPVEEDREFRCCNPECELVSCRLCREESHVPKTCEEARKERGVSERHQVEEAMSEAYIRPCPRCKLKIVKEIGCNKMTCPRCRCMMCYMCKKDITREGYSHFGRGKGACRVDDDPRQDHNQQEVDQAEKTAIDKIRAEKPDLTRDDLLVNRPGEKKSRDHRPRRPYIDLPPPLYTPRPHDIVDYQGLQHLARPQGAIPGMIHFPEFLDMHAGMNYGRVALPGENRHMALPGYDQMANGLHLFAAPPAPAPMNAYNNRVARPPAYAGFDNRIPRTMPIQPAPARNARNSGTPAALGIGPGMPNVTRAPRPARDPAPNRRARSNAGTGLHRMTEYPRAGPQQVPQQPPLVDLTQPERYGNIGNGVRR